MLNLEEYKAVHIFPVLQDRNKKDCKFCGEFSFLNQN